MMIEVRQAEACDSRAISRISATLGYEAISGEAVEHWMNMLLASEEHRVWICEAGGEVVGWLHAVRSVRLASAPFIEVLGLAVDPLYHRQGMGMSLMDQVLEWARPQGLKVRVRCNSERVQALQFYQSMGFCQTKSQTVFDYYL